jgi:hypothetical protein
VSNESLQSNRRVWSLVIAPFAGDKREVFGASLSLMVNVRALLNGPSPSELVAWSFQLYNPGSKATLDRYSVGEDGKMTSISGVEKSLLLSTTRW